MGDKAQPAFLEKALLEIKYNKLAHHKLALNTGSIAKNFGEDYSFLEDWNTKIEGCDIEKGPLVDHVFDLTEAPPIHLVDNYDLIITSSTLEHVTAPWKAAECLEKLLKPGGHIYISVPWVWRYHAYPNDYWRFNRHSLDFLFQKTIVIDQAWSTSPDCILYPFSDNFDDHNSLIVNHEDKKGFLHRFARRLFSSVPQTSFRRKYLPYLQIHQLRRKPLT